MSKRNIIYVIYCLIFITQLYAIFYHLEALRLGTKPLIGFSLLLWLLFDEANQAPFRYWLALAIGFGMLGDIFLMLPDSESTFIAGLASFLIGHLLYVVIFLRQQQFSLNSFNTRDNARLIKQFSVVMAVIGLAIYAYLWSDLGDMKLPVAVYILLIALMVISAIGRYRAVSQLSFITVLVGAILFALSDSILAIDRFSHPFAQANFYIMLTYMAAQFLIVTQSLARTSIASTAPFNPTK